MSDFDAEYQRLARQLSRERIAAREVIRTLLPDPWPYLDAPLPPDWLTAGMAFELADTANDLLERSPDRSAALAELATIVAAGLDAEYPRVMRAQAVSGAWKEVANAQRYRSKYEEALAALERGDEVLENEPVLAHDRAILLFARATTLGEINRYAEALELLDEAADVFHDFGDEYRIAQCELLRGMLHQRRGKAAAARAAYRRALAGARKDRRRPDRRQRALEPRPARCE